MRAVQTPVERTYALFDVIGVKQALSNGTAATKLVDFWNVVEDWTNHQASNLGQVHTADGALVTPSPILRTYSDSALMRMPEELDIEDFYGLVLDLKGRIETRAAPCYVIVNRDDEIPSPAPIIYVSAGGDPTPRYLNVCGSGKAFPHLYLADEALRGAKSWHGKYSVYCVGDESRPSNLAPQDGIAIPGCSRQLLALK